MVLPWQLENPFTTATPSLRIAKSGEIKSEGSRVLSHDDDDDEYYSYNYGRLVGSYLNGFQVFLDLVFKNSNFVDIVNKLVLAGATGLDKATLGWCNALPLNECHVNSPVKISHMYDIYPVVN